MRQVQQKFWWRLSREMKVGCNCPGNQPQTPTPTSLLLIAGSCWCLSLCLSLSLSHTHTHTQILRQAQTPTLHSLGYITFPDNIVVLVFSSYLNAQQRSHIYIHTLHIHISILTYIYTRECTHKHTSDHQLQVPGVVSGKCSSVKLVLTLFLSVWQKGEKSQARTSDFSLSLSLSK